MKFLELFAGAGGMSRGLEAGGLHCIGHAEIEPHARAVLRYRYPDVPLYGDVTQVTGEQAGACDLVSFGAPCQDLSVAGKRAGLAGARSSLFFEGVRLWNETGATYALYENVMGALSSNNGKDFAAVLSAFVGSTVHVPADGWGGGGGVVAGRTAVAAWRVLDLQHFGPPQRRVRVFVLAARAGGVDPAEVLALNEGVCRHSSPREQAREIAAASTGGGVEGGVMGFESTGGSWGVNEGDTSPPIKIGTGLGISSPPAVLSFNCKQDGTPNAEDVTPTLTAMQHRDGNANGGGQIAVLSFAENQKGETRLADVTQALAGGGGKPGQGYADVFAYNSYQRTVGDIASTLRSDCGGALLESGVVCTTGDITHALTTQPGATDDGTGRGTPIVAYGRSSFGGWDGAEVIAPVCSHDAKETTSIVLDQQLANGSEVAATLTVAYADKHGLEDQHVNSGCPLFVLSSGQANASVNKNISPTLDVTGEPPIAFNARPRRLTPLECERLMSWPDQCTAIGRKDDGTEYALSDTARYRLCGNGVGSVCAEWIGRRLVEAVTAQGAA